MKKLSTILLVFAVAYLVVTCKQNQNVDPSSTSLNKQLIAFKYTGSSSNVALGTLADKDKNINLNFYGDTDDKGETKHIRALTIQKVNTDSVYNFVFDEKDRVKSLFLTLNGKVSNDILQFNYQNSDSVVVISRYSVDPTNLNVKPKDQVTVRNVDLKVLNYTKNGRVASASVFHKYAKAAFLGALGALVIADAGFIAAAFTVPGFVVVLAGGWLIYKGVTSVPKIYELLNTLWNSLVPSSEAAEAGAPPANFLASPYAQLDNVKFDPFQSANFYFNASINGTNIELESNTGEFNNNNNFFRTIDFNNKEKKVKRIHVKSDRGEIVFYLYSLDASYKGNYLIVPVAGDEYTLNRAAIEFGSKNIFSSQAMIYDSNGYLGIYLTLGTPKSGFYITNISTSINNSVLEGYFEYTCYTQYNLEKPFICKGNFKIPILN